MEVNLGSFKYWDPKEEMGAPKEDQKRIIQRLSNSSLDPKERSRGKLSPLACGQLLATAKEWLWRTLRPSRLWTTREQWRWSFTTSEILGRLRAPVAGGAALGH